MVAVFIINKFKFIFYFQLKNYSADFTQVEIWFRFVFLVLTFMVTVSNLFEVLSTCY